MILELGNPLPEMVIMDVQLKDCYWYVNPKAEDEQEAKEVSSEVSFQFEEVKMIGKKVRIRTMSADEINKALLDNGIEPVVA